MIDGFIFFGIALVFFLLGVFLGRMDEESELDKDIIQALSQQVMLQNEEINGYRLWIRNLRKTPHKWLQDEIDGVLGEE